jgi:hypothetical protein
MNREGFTVGDKYKGHYAELGKKIGFFLSILKSLHYAQAISFVLSL